MTDWGSFQLSVYGDVDITNKEVIEFELIKTDIGTSLDIPTAPFVTREKAEADLEIYFGRARGSCWLQKFPKYGNEIEFCSSGFNFSWFKKKMCRWTTKLDADLYPIGAVVPLMESYHYKELVDVVMNSVAHLPDSKPRHLMGAGHPMILPWL